MLKNYITIAYRNLLRKKTYAIINIFGLSLGIAFSLLIYLYIEHERSFDNFHANAKNLYRLEIGNLHKIIDTGKKKTIGSFLPFLQLEEEENAQLTMPMILAPDLQANFPEIQQIVRIKQGWRETVHYNNQQFREEKVLFADTNFLEVFTFPLKQGKKATALASPHNIIITESTAHKYFGTENPVGKTIEFIWEKPQLFTVTAVAADVPANSSIQFDFLIPIKSHPSYESYINSLLNTSSVLTIIQLADKISLQAFGEKLNKYGRSFFKKSLEEQEKRNNNGVKLDIHLSARPFAEGHYQASGPWGHFTSLKNIYQISCLTVLILIIACLNYLLLTLTNTAARVQEVGLRKVIGAPRIQIIGQFWVETQLMVGIAVLAGWIMAVGLLPYFGQLVDASIEISFYHSFKILLFLFILALLIGVLAGIYPALFISGFKPLSIVKKHQTFRLNPGLSRIMVLLQYSSCITLLTASLVIARQMTYMNEKDLGFDKGQVLVVENPHWGNKAKTIAVGERMQQFAAVNSTIAGFTATGHTFGYGFDLNRYVINGNTESITVMEVDYNYFNMLGLKILHGRNFSPAFSTDTSRTEEAVVINETLFNMLGKEARIGEYNEIIRRRIIGVVKDYHYTSLLSPIGPAMHQLNSSESSFYWFKLHPGNISHTISQVQEQWNRITGNAPFTYSFLDEDAAKLYKSQQQWLKIIYAATIFAIVVACMGLFGLSGINALNRTKEIGVRKVLGASTRQIFVLLNKETIRLTLISFLIAIPVAYYFMYQWLQNFAYRISLEWEMFAIAGVIGALTALLAVSYHSIRASLSNPVDTLRDE